MKKALILVFFLFFLIGIFLVYGEDNCPNGVCNIPNNEKPSSNEIGSKITNSNLNSGDFVVEDSNKIEIKDNKVTIKSDQTIKIKGNSYYVKEGSIFTFNNKGELTDGTELTLTKDEKYLINGYKFKLSKDTKISFKDGKINIKVPDETKIEEPEIIENQETKFEFEGENLKLPNNDLFQGKLGYETNKEGKGGFCFYNDAKIDSLNLKNSDNKKVNIDFKGEYSKDYENSYISIGEKTLAIGKNSEGKGIDVEFTNGNKYFKGIIDKQLVSMQAGRDKEIGYKEGKGSIKITNRNSEIPLVETKGDFEMKIDGQIFESKIDDKGSKNVYVSSNKNDKLAYPFEMRNYDLNDNLLFSSYKVIFKNQGWEAISINEHTRKLNEYGLDENGNVVDGTEPISKDVPRLVKDPYKFVSFVNDVTSSDNLHRKGTGVRTGNVNALQLVESLTKDRDNSDIFTKVHEETHWANMDVTSRNGVFADYAPNANSNRAFLTGEIDPKTGEPIQVQITGTGVRKIDVAGYVPTSFRDYYFNLYFGSVHANKDAVHVFEDLSAYHMETLYASQNNQANQNGAENTFKSVIHTAALGMYLANNNPNYWNSKSGEQFKSFLAWGAQESIKYGGTGTLQKLQSNPDTANMRQFFVNTYGQEWTKKVLGFE